MSHIIYLDDFFVVRKKKNKLFQFIRNLFPDYGHLSSQRTYVKRRLLALLSVLGGIFGLLLGIIIVIIQQQFEVIMITPTLAYPVVFSLKNVAIVLATISILGFVASLIASSRVSKKLLD